MKKIFISCLGTRKQVECRYAIKDRYSELVPFIQEALITQFCPKWNENDHIYILCTPEAHKNNWEGRKDFGESLKTRLQRLNLKASVSAVPITEGKDAQDITTIIQVFLDIIPDGSEVILDISHSIRSLPFLYAVALTYARAIKGITVSGVYYGPFEVLGSTDKIRQIPEEERIVPVLDLTDVWHLIDWGYAIHLFCRAGYASDLKNIAPLPCANKGIQDSVQRVTESVNDFTKDIITLRIPHLEKRAQQVYKAILLTSDSILEPSHPINLLCQALKDQLSYFEVPYGFGASNWCLSHGMILQACILAKDTVLSTLTRLNILVEGAYEWNYLLSELSRLSESSTPSPTNRFNMTYILIGKEVVKEAFRSLLFPKKAYYQSTIKDEINQIWSNAVRNYRLRNLSNNHLKIINKYEESIHNLARAYTDVIWLIEDMLRGGRGSQSPSSEEFIALCHKRIKAMEHALTCFIERVNSKA